MNKKPFYITTTLPYVNADPHIGFALELVQADIIARWKELNGSEIFFNTGTDEHGQKMFNIAKEAGKDIKDYVDEYADKFQSLKDKLNLHSNLHFIRTTDPKHIGAAQELWRKCFAKGDIYKKKYKGLYCVGDEAFIKETDLVNGRCPNHPNLELQLIEEENYFFKLENYKEKLKKYLASDAVVPDWRRDEALAIVDGMEDFSISREKSRLSWGVPVPDDDTQTMYVWFDALTSYISTLGWPSDPDGNYKKFWEDGYKLQLAGKDQVKFQSVIWQAMLMSAGLPNTDKVFYHGFINSGGQKMSKSMGNVISPDDLIDRYGTEATRVMLAGVNQFDDTDINIGVEGEGFDLTYNGNLANGLGNLVSRVMKLAEINLTEPIISEDDDFPPKLPEYEIHMNNFEIQKAIYYIWAEIKGIDGFIQTEEPFKQSDLDKRRETIAWCVKRVARVARKLAPFMPQTSEKIIQAIRENKKPENLFPRLNA